jgi:hypothetical protein
MDIATSTGQRPRILEWLITLAAATASTYGINRSTAAGTRTTPVVVMPDDPAEPTLTGIASTDTALAHSVQPTLSSDYHERVALPASIGQGVLWTFPRGLTLAINLSWVLQNLGTNGVLDSRVVADV